MTLEETGPRAVVRFSKSTTSGKEGFEVQFEHPDADMAFQTALRLRNQCAAAIEPPTLTEQLEKSLAAI